MNSSFQPDPNSFDDTEGHGARFNGIDGPDTDAVEGHGTVRGGLLPEGRDYDKVDVEGHGLRGNVDEPATDEVEGHATRVKVIDGPDTDEVEGHALRVKGVDGPDTDDVEGHGVRVKI